MKVHTKKIKTTKGFTLIEALTVLFIFSVITVTFYYVVSNGLRYIQDAKNRLGALSVANEKMEIVRNLAYNSIGTQEGEVSGNIPDDETISENTKKYNVHTLVEYVDDPFDGLAYSDAIWFEDYKRVTVTVSWGSGEVKLVSRFVPPGAEVPKPGDGILAINIFSDQSGEAVSGATVHVTNSDTGLNSEKQTDSSGNATFSGDRIKNSVQKYIVSVSKDGYEAVNTLPPYPDTAFNPVDVHASVVVGAVNVANFIQNKLANLKVISSDLQGQSASGISFHIKGGRKIGTETIFPNNPIYNLDADGSTGTDGEKNFSGISPGQYDITLSNIPSDYEFVSTDPASPFALHSDESLDFKIKLAKKNVSSLLVKVKSSFDGSAVPGAQIQLSSALGYDKTLASGTDGMAFFPDDSNPLEATTYNLKIVADGFSDSESQITINANELKMEEITLTANP